MPESKSCFRELHGDADGCLCSSRKPFAPHDHWLAESEIDLQPFVEAAM